MTQIKSNATVNSRRKADTNTPFLIAQEGRNSVDATLSNLSTSKQGLTQDDVEDRLQTHGLNQVSHEKAPNVFFQLLAAFNNPFIYVLIILAIISDITNYWLPKEHGQPTSISSVVIIGTMVTLSAALRFIQEFRTNKAAEALKSMVRTTATVRRRAHTNAPEEVTEIALQQLVPGDIIHLMAGDMIPADIKLLEARDLFISQAALTGESIPVEKTDTPYQSPININNQASETANADSNHEAELIEMPNICLMGTNVSSGTAMAVVVATGSETYFGSLAKSIIGTRSQTAFDRGVNSVSWLLIRFMLVMVPIVLLINGFTKGNWIDAALFALAVAVGLTPEMLPMIVSSNLAKGAMMMARRKVVVKHLNAIQNFGAMDVLCTDKTGTLTQDRIILEHHINVQGSNDEHVLALAWLNSHHQSGLKNLMDQAILHFAKENQTLSHLSCFYKVDELPFDFVRRRLSIVVGDEHDNHTLICKGAVEEMLAIATHINDSGHVIALDTTRREKLMALAEQYNKQGFRVLLVGTRDLGIKGCELPLQKDDERDLVVHGLLTFLDPPKESAITAIAALRENGVMVKVLTGDNPVVTSKVCRDVGLEPGEPLLGTEIERLDDTALAQLVEQRTIFAKLTPLQKSRVLKTLQKNGHTVGFLGDGINDAPALRDADVGISVDTGTDIAKESADIILLEKNLMVLEEGVIKGRETFGNIIKYLNMTASSNFGNVFSVLIASAFLPFLPMLAIQLLIQNLLYDISQLALPWDRMDKEFLRKPRKWDAQNIGRFMVWLGPTSSIFDVTTFALMWFVFGANTPAHQALFHSGWFIEGLLSQTLVVHMLRTQKIPFIQSTAALPVIVATVLVVVLGITLPFSPLGPLVGLQALPWHYFPWLVAILFSYCLVAQGMKRFYIRRFGCWF
ncbi:magnesium-translocating P-type ATPase [Photobacterium kishitanii]|uniref:magnesium-translocating P-type ATPase n=1 Tax=Photobacterium kishitanii TaxID=318456 RepID=UPI0005D40355|nr:magnesium-translocating P-type ATPase [Photobacterium kishitanii]KJG09506.1 magnesium ABC transporter ATPase [Photobacterium kishitanii]PSU19249.1 magnesium-translocating P-type ATPase [Photobacterium kishitanii]PSV07854.1 magnesium-translocating P-type ATPase [Photobacterium kishitanii]PSV15192.1 magnesium-translocating P-type ATPase [Photobacterium kishitanii]PSV76342.1 magnesium-translocating P-type ATPase [Photobacterium kishitanii]